MADEIPFTIDVDGKPKLLFRVQKRPLSGDLTIKTNFEAVTDPGTFKPLARNRLLEEHISIHTSPKSPTNINAITYTQKLAGGGSKGRTLYQSDKAN
jgi:hypothetical protein